MGAMAGGCAGVMLNEYTLTSSSGAIYAMLGMGAFMGATLNAPLAALTALLELTANPHIILPGMLAIVAADIDLPAIIRNPIGVDTNAPGPGAEFARA